MLRFRLLRHGGEQASRPARATIVLRSHDDEVRVLEHRQVGTDRVLVQADLGRELVDRQRLPRSPAGTRAGARGSGRRARGDEAFSRSQREYRKRLPHGISESPYDDSGLPTMRPEAGSSIFIV